MTRKILNLSLGLVLGAASQTIGGPVSGPAVGPKAPMRYAFPQAIDITLTFDGGADASGTYTLKGTVKATLADLTHVKAKVVPSVYFVSTGKPATFAGTLEKGKARTITAQVRYKGSFEVAGVGLHVEYDFPYAQAKAYVLAHPSEYPNAVERANLLRRIEERKGTREIQSGTAYRHEP